jgi:hypothetical protein
MGRIENPLFAMPPSPPDREAGYTKGRAITRPPFGSVDIVE